MSSIALMTNDTYQPKLVISSGEPAGIGPDLIVKLFQSDMDLGHLNVLIDPNLLQQRAELMGANIGKFTSLNSCKNYHDTKPSILPVRLRASVVPGELDIRNTPYLLEMLDKAVNHCLSGKYDAMVTGPLQKSVINDAGIYFSGHTEYLAGKCGNTLPVMLLAYRDLRVALATTHLPLREVPDAITKESLERIITIVDNDLRQRFGIKQPEIIICGLNPHAGENGHLGGEEGAIIEPVIKRLKNKGLKLTGPLPADTAFRPDLRDTTDAYVAMYHDQGLSVLKAMGFGGAVNISLGLPIIRTSVDHGTALSLAGTGKADINSLLAAIEMAEMLAVKQTALHLNSTRHV